MPEPKDILGKISGGRVLDVATGTGGFIHFLVDGLKDYTEIIGIDASDRGAAAFTEAFKDRPGIRFEKMDALHMEYPVASFNTVCISNSLHHFEDPSPVLAECLRVLRPGGHLVISEMYRDRQSEAQMTHVLLHSWWAAVDQVNGVIHRESYQRGELVRMISKLDLKEVTFFDLCDLSGNPKDPQVLAQLDPAFDRYLQRSEGHPELVRQGELLRKRVAEIGFHGATTLFALGVKPVPSEKKK